MVDGIGIMGLIVRLFLPVFKIHPGRRRRRRREVMASVYRLVSTSTLVSPVGREEVPVGITTGC